MDHKSEAGQHQTHHQHHPKSSSELLSSAKYLADAAKSTFSHESDKLDHGRAAGAAADLLEAASHYGKLEEKSFGKYVEQAEDYLHKYSTKTTTAVHGSSDHGPTTTTTHTETHSTSHPPTGEHGHSSGSGGGGYGDYMKMAEGFLKGSSEKPSSTHQSGEHGHEGGDGGGGGYGDYMKLAEGFLKGNSESGGEHGHGGAGDYLKMAQGFLKKN
ncbi:hypothetical protein RJ641_003091 [Dillenia turbinata]|uniref:Nodulin-related protein 1 n=1 Tax=Dillenia turbinata TaxID=194707 RepID=A0AAN8VAE5_9MAGN